MSEQELTKNYLNDAFKAMDALNEDDDISIKDDEFINVADTKEAAAGLKAEEKTDEEADDVVDVIDSNAFKEKEMQPNYDGYIVLDCDVCHSKIYKKPEEIKIDITTGKVNVDEECPFCMTDGGFTVCGKIVPCDVKEIEKEQERDVEAAHKESDEDKIEPDDDKEPKKDENEKASIVPLSDEEKQQIVDGSYGQDVNADVSDIDDETFSELGEKYLKSIYDNVASYKLTEGAVKGNSLILDGKIKFKSGKEQNNRFVFESKTITKTGKIKMVGRNESLARASKAFILTGCLQNKKLMLESLTYNYSARDAETNKVKKLYGTIKA